MTVAEAELQFLTRQLRGHLATVASDGSLQVKRLGFRHNATLDTIDIAGFKMAESAKCRNVQTNPAVALVVDEVTGDSKEGAHFLEVRGVAVVAVGAEDPSGHLAPEIIRIHLRRIVSFNDDPAHPGLEARDILRLPPKRGDLRDEGHRRGKIRTARRAPAPGGG